ncbi:MFS transporter [Vagococcus carniphilus]|uniref:MFS transporter n=1 Tax=Vagococcus carniphilus TaxID=218144 RepID=UPI002892510F|nr:MFS transporter [Vagococcus carniphilus]MDT2813531.1 MFS transporter [Vagococcus carniphilus]MDT2829966.1 MFS transporter [Vagococcus carniphilus]MDT2838401.1 MFS transporter [Vagococcus carniphilus]MDT2850150.1 MFS transporter [Vagococcus carniphilus]MDT2854397.1 MFS transporter [Vagococcus carniphilus]
MNQEKAHKFRWLSLAAVGLFSFMSTLDGSIVNIALPTISEDIGVPMNQSEWVVSVYLMAICVFLLFFGKVGDSFGKIRVFKIGTIVFIIGSFLCGIPGSLALLLASRIVQAIGASMTMATSTGIITEIFPLQERGRALGLIGSFVSLGAIAGPGIGGVILSHFNWSYIFWINVPVGIITMMFGWYFLPKTEFKSGEKIDYIGFILFALFIMLFFGGIFLGQEKNFTDPLIIGMIVVSLISLVLFYKYENKHDSPLVHFHLFSNQIFTVSLLTATLIFVTNFFANVINPFYLQNVLGLEANVAGFLMMVFPLVMVVGAPLSGYLTDKKGPHLITLIGLILLTLGQIGYLVLGETSPVILFVLIMSLVGAGNAMFQAPNNTIIMSSVDKSEYGVAGSMNALARNFGMVVGISLSTTILYQSMSFEMGERVVGFVDGRPDIFVYGMHFTYMVSFAICLFATVITFWRFSKAKKETKK